MICGLVLGLSWLYRLDMGTTGLAASMAFLGLAEARRPPRNIVRAVRTVFVLACAFAVLPIAWFGYVALKLGGAAPLDFLGTTIIAARSIAGGMAQPLGFDPIVILAYILVPATLLLGAIISLSRERTGRAIHVPGSCWPSPWSASASSTRHCTGRALFTCFRSWCLH